MIKIAETIKGISVVLSGETTALNAALADVNKSSRDIQSELRQVEKLLKLDPTNTELVAQKQKLLADAVANAEAKLNSLKNAQEQVNEQFQRGDINEGQYRAFQREVAAAEQQLKRLNDRLIETEEATKSSSERLQDFADKAKGVSDKLKDVGENMSTHITAPVAVGMALATERTQELRRELGLLETNAAMAGAKIEDVNKAYRTLAGFRPDDLEANNEALSAMLNMGFKGDPLQKITELVVGASTKYKDTLNPEGIAADMQESLAQGQTTGMFDEMLNRLGVNLDAFNAKLAIAKKNNTELDLVMQTMVNTGLNDYYKKYTEINQVMIEHNQKIYDLQKSLADLAKTIQPVIDKITEITKVLVDFFNKLPESTQTAIIAIAGSLALLGPVIFGISQLIFGIAKSVEFLKGLANLNIVSALATVFQTFGLVLSWLITDILPVVAAGIVEFLLSPIGLVLSAIALIGAAVYMVITNWEPIKQFFTDVWNGLILGAQMAIDYLTQAWTGFKDFFISLWTAIWEPIKGFINLIIDGINTLIDGLNSLQITVPEWSPVAAGETWGIDIDKIPHLERGGRLTSAGSVLVGEKRPEVLNLPAGATVTPLDKVGAQIDYNKLASVVVGALQSANIIARIDPSQRNMTNLVRAMQPAVASEKTRGGGF